MVKGIHAGRGLVLLVVIVLLSSDMWAQTATFSWDDQGLTAGATVATGLTFSGDDFDVDLDYNVTTSGGTFGVPSGDPGHVTFSNTAFGANYSQLIFGFDNTDDDPDDYITVDIVFSDSLTGVSFSMLDLDRGSSNDWVDAVEIIYNSSSYVADNSDFYSLGSRVAVDNESYMTGFEGTNNVGAGSANGNVAVDLGDTKVKSLTIKYFSSDDAVSNPSTQYIGISDITYDVECTDHELTLELIFDNYPEETSWDIQDSGSNVVASGGTYGNQPDGSTLDINVCLPDGDYTLTMYDAYADGMCCSYGSGSYALRDFSSTILAAGAAFAASEATFFSLNGGGVLPIELAYFNATVDGNNEVLLTWETKSELNNDFFIIRRSTDFENWTELTRVPGAGTTSDRQDYSFRDRNPLEGRSYYYLSQVDFDGTIDHVMAKSVQIGPEVDLLIFPNPVDDFLVVGIDETELSSVSLMNLAGAKVQLDYVVNGRQIEFNTSSLNAGIYFLQLETHTDVLVQRIVVN